MKKPFISTLSEVLGLALSLYIAITANYSGWDFAREIIIGVFLGYVIGLVLSWKDYGALLWGFMALLFALALEWAAGSQKIRVLDNLIYASSGMFIALGFQFSRKQVFVGGMIGVVIGCMLGLIKSQYYGYANLSPGLFNALLSSIRLLIFGMFFGSMYMALFGSYHRKDDLG